MLLIHLVTVMRVAICQRIVICSKYATWNVSSFAFLLQLPVQSTQCYADHTSVFVIRKRISFYAFSPIVHTKTLVETMMETTVRAACRNSPPSSLAPVALGLIEERRLFLQAIHVGPRACEQQTYFQ